MYRTFEYTFFHVQNVVYVEVGQHITFEVDVRRTQMWRDENIYGVYNSEVTTFWTFETFSFSPID